MKSENLFELLSKKGTFNQYMWSDCREEEKKEFVSFLLKMPFQIRDAVISVCGKDLSIKMPLDSCEFYKFLKGFDNITVSKEILLESKGVHAVIQSSKKAPEVKDEMMQAFGEDVAWFFGLANGEGDSHYYFYANLNISYREGFYVLKQDGKWLMDEVKIK